MKNVMFFIGNDNTDNIEMKNRNSQELSINRDQGKSTNIYTLEYNF